jgi:hypothetical protein
VCLRYGWLLGDPSRRFPGAIGTLEGMVGNDMSGLDDQRILYPDAYREKNISYEKALEIAAAPSSELATWAISIQVDWNEASGQPRVAHLANTITSQYSDD